MAAPRSKQPKKGSSIVAAPTTRLGARSAQELIAEAPKRYFAGHYWHDRRAILADGRFRGLVDFTDGREKGRRFFDAANNELVTEIAFFEAVKRESMVLSVGAES